MCHKSKLCSTVAGYHIQASLFPCFLFLPWPSLYLQSSTAPILHLAKSHPLPYTQRKTCTGTERRSAPCVAHATCMNTQRHTGRHAPSTHTHTQRENMRKGHGKRRSVIGVKINKYGLWCWDNIPEYTFYCRGQKVGGAHVDVCVRECVNGGGLCECEPRCVYPWGSGISSLPASVLPYRG